jgi:NADH-quinone oxidoreductase subunit M
MNILEIICVLLLVTITYLLIENNVTRLKNIGLSVSFILLILGNLLWINFDNKLITYQYQIYIIISEKLNLVYHLGIDGISLFFVILTLLLLVLCLLCSWSTVTYK